MFALTGLGTLQATGGKSGVPPVEERGGGHQSRGQRQGEMSDELPCKHGRRRSARRDGHGRHGQSTAVFPMPPVAEMLK